MRVTSSGDGRAAVAALERDPARYGLVVTDLQLPGLDGLEVLEAARRANPSVYVVIVTGYASLDSAIRRCAWVRTTTSPSRSRSVSST